MRLTREFEESILKLYRQGKIVGGAYTGNGNEATAVGSAFALEKQDYLFPMHRDMGTHLVKGQSLRNLMLQHLARGDLDPRHARVPGRRRRARPQARIPNTSRLRSFVVTPPTTRRSDR